MTVRGPGIDLQPSRKGRYHGPRPDPLPVGRLLTFRRHGATWLPVKARSPDGATTLGEARDRREAGDVFVWNPSKGAALGGGAA